MSGWFVPPHSSRDSSIWIEQVPVLTDNYAYILCDGERNSRDAYVVDPGESDPLLRKLHERDLNLVGILVTHHHPDHIGGIVGLCENRNVPVYCSEMDQARVPLASHILHDQDRIELFKRSFEILALPGHTKGQVGFYSAEFSWLFSGDTLFPLGCGRLLEGTAEELFHTLERLKTLPRETLIFGGHEYTLKNAPFAQQLEPDNSSLKARIDEAKKIRSSGKSTVPTSLALELDTNPFLRCDSLTIRKNLGMSVSTSKLEVFREMRRQRDHF